MKKYKLLITLPKGSTIVWDDKFNVYNGVIEEVKEECNCRDLGRGYCMCDEIGFTTSGTSRTCRQCEHPIEKGLCSCESKQKPSDWIEQRARYYAQGQVGEGARLEALIDFLDEHFSK